MEEVTWWPTVNIRKKPPKTQRSAALMLSGFLIFDYLNIRHILKPKFDLANAFLGLIRLLCEACSETSFCKRVLGFRTEDIEMQCFKSCKTELIANNFFAAGSSWGLGRGYSIQ